MEILPLVWGKDEKKMTLEEFIKKQKEMTEKHLKYLLEQGNENTFGHGYEKGCLSMLEKLETFMELEKTPAGEPPKGASPERGTAKVMLEEKTVWPLMGWDGCLCPSRE